MEQHVPHDGRDQPFSALVDQARFELARQLFAGLNEHALPAGITTPQLAVGYRNIGTFLTRIPARRAS